MGDGTVTDLSRKGLGIRGNAAVTPGTELTLFLYLPDGQDPLFIMEAKVVWSVGHQEPTSVAGDFYDLRAEMDLLVGLSNCPQERNPCNGFNPTPMGVIVYE